MAAQAQLAKGAKVKVHVRSGGVAAGSVWWIARTTAQNCLTPRIPLGMTGHPGTINEAVQ